MRIIGGSAGGLILKAPKGLDVRPTPDLVRQALFNSLAPRIEGSRVLELFGGTGALSLECLSRGAREALCIELSPKHARIIEQNFASLKLGPKRAPGVPPGPGSLTTSTAPDSPRASTRRDAGGTLFQVRVQDVFTALPQLGAAGELYDLIVADPPYGEKNVGKRSQSLAQRCLDDETLPRLLAPGGLFVLGHARRDTLTLPERWHERKFMKHGDSIMRFLDLKA